MAEKMEKTTEHIAFAADDVETADIDLELGLSSTNVYALEDSNQLIDGAVSYVGDLIFDADNDAGAATVRLDARSRGFWWFNPTNRTSDDSDEW